MSFISFLKHVGHDFKVGFNYVLPIAETAGEVAVKLYAPELSPLFNGTVSAVVLAEQKYAALGQEKVGAKKLADVLSLMEPIIAQGLADAGLNNKTEDVVNYINSVVTILNTLPAPAIATKPPVQVTPGS